VKSNWSERKRANWMLAFEGNLVRLRPELVGRVDWDTAAYLYNSGVSPEVAAERVSKSDKRFQ